MNDSSKRRRFRRWMWGLATVVTAAVLFSVLEGPRGPHDETFPVVQSRSVVMSAPPPAPPCPEVDTMTADAFAGVFDHGEAGDQAAFDAFGDDKIKLDEATQQQKGEGQDGAGSSLTAAQPVSTAAASAALADPAATDSATTPVDAAALAQALSTFLRAGERLKELATGALSDPEVIQVAAALAADPPLVSAAGSGADPAATPSPSASAALVETTPAAPRPPWIVKRDQTLGRQAQIVIESGPYATTQECREGLTAELAKITKSRLARLASQETGRPAVEVPELDELHLSADELLDQLRREEFVETVESSVDAFGRGPMLRAYALVEFKAEDDQRLLGAWHDFARRRGLAHVGGGFGAVLATLAASYGLLKVDDLTRGHYSKRLFLGVPGVIIGLGTMLFFLRS